MLHTADFALAWPRELFVDEARVLGEAASAHKVAPAFPQHLGSRAFLAIR